MKKTVTANIGGLNFYIEEEAYEKLSYYLESIKNAMKGDEGYEEVMADIEGRIAELLRSSKPDESMVVDMKDVDRIIDVMGSPEVIAGEDPEDGQHSEKTKSEEKAEKRFYRDGDDKVIAGVCSGIAAYFNWDATWVRVIFAILILSYGFGIWAYIILWIVSPEAKTTAEKLKMRGKDVTLENIKAMANDLAENVKKMSKDKDFEGVKKQTNKVFEAIGNFFNFLVELIKKAFGLILFLLSFALIAVAFLVTTQQGSVTHIRHQNDEAIHYDLSVQNITDYFFDNQILTYTALIAVFFIIAIPAFGIFTSGRRLVYNYTPKRRNAFFSGSFFWIVSVLVLAGTLVVTAMEYKEANFMEYQVTELKSIDSDTLYIENTGDCKDVYFHHILLKNPESELKTYKISKPYLSIRQASDTLFSLRIRKESRGSSSNKALTHAESIDFNVALNDSLLTFDEFWSFQRTGKYRAQEIHAELRVPRGKKVSFKNDCSCILKNAEGIKLPYTEEKLKGYWEMRGSGLRAVE